MVRAVHVVVTEHRVPKEVRPLLQLELYRLHDRSESACALLRIEQTHAREDRCFEGVLNPGHRRLSDPYVTGALACWRFCNTWLMGLKVSFLALVRSHLSAPAHSLMPGKFARLAAPKLAMALIPARRLHLNGLRRGWILAWTSNRRPGREAPGARAE